MTLDIEALPAARSQQDQRALVREANATPYIARLTVADLVRLEAAASIFYYYAGEDVIGFGAWQRVTDRWDELGPFFNRDAYRGQGLGRRMFHDVLDHLEAQGRSVYAVTKNGAVKHLLLGHGFQQTTLRGVPWPLLLHMVMRLSPRRLAAGLRKIDRHEPTIHLIRPYPHAGGRRA